MAAPRLSIIVPTIGRPTLEATLRSIADQWDGEQVIVLSHRGQEEAAEIFRATAPSVLIDGSPAWTFAGVPDHGDNFYGHDLRNLAATGLAVGSHVATIDDDDVYLDGALEALADAVTSDAPVTVFKAKWGPGHPASGVELWHTKDPAKGNVATPMICAVRSSARWGTDYFGDYEYATQLLALYPRETWAWDERLIALVRPVAVDD